MDLFNTDPHVLEKYSRDASLFKVRPLAVAKPQTKDDLRKLVKYAKDNHTSLTMRAGGSDMSGGAIGEGVVVDVTALNKITRLGDNHVTVEPGVFYRDLEKELNSRGLMLPCYPASKNLAGIGGMIGNNCGGEKTLRYGKMEDFIVSAKWIFADGNEYEVKPLSREKLAQKLSLNTYEGEIYRKIKALVDENRELLAEAKPKVSKNSSGYYLWNVYPERVEGHGEMFDLNRLLVGSQGTLGILTEATLRLERVKTHHDLVVLFFKSWDEMPAVVNHLLKLKPEGLETFDKETLKLGIRFMPEVAEKAGENFLSFAKKFLPEAFISLQMLSIPEIVLLVEFAEDNEHLLKEKVHEAEAILKHFHVHHEVIERDSDEERFWIMRRESFNLLRQHVDGKRTVPLVDDFCVPVEAVPKFLPRAKKLLQEVGIKVNIAGHAGNGNFHIIPLMDLTNEEERGKLIPLAERFYNLVAEYGGTLSGEHNDGLVRTPFLNKIFKPEVLNLFKEVKNTFDPQNIFNPKKKVGATLEDFEKALD